MRATGAATSGFVPVARKARPYIYGSGVDGGVEVVVAAFAFGPAPGLVAGYKEFAAWVISGTQQLHHFRHVVIQRHGPRIGHLLRAGESGLHIGG